MKKICKIFCFIVFLALSSGLSQLKPSEQIAGLGDFYEPPDYQQMAEAFSTIEMLGKHYLKKGMTKGQVEGIFGKPGLVKTVNDKVEMWSYLTSISGTYSYWVVFAHGALDFFGPTMTTELEVKYRVQK